MSTADESREALAKDAAREASGQARRIITQPNEPESPTNHTDGSTS